MFRRSDRAPGTGVSALRGPTLGALAGALTILPFGYIANRYLADALPVLVIAGLVGVHVLLARTAGRSRRADVGCPGSGSACWPWSGCGSTSPTRCSSSASTAPT